MQLMVQETEAFVREVDAAILKVGEFKTALDSLPDMKVVTIVTKYVTEGKPEDVATATQTLTEHVDVTGDAADAANNLTDEMARLEASIKETGDAADALGVQVQDGLNVGFLKAAEASNGLAAGLKAIVPAAKDAQDAWTVLGNVSFLAVARMNSIGGIIHWIVAGGSELAATLLPAIIALGAGARVELEGFRDMYTHLSAVNVVGQSIGQTFGKTDGQILGMGDSLQKAQTAADPKTFELLGAAINAVNSSSGQFVQMGNQLVPDPGPVCREDQR